MHDALQATAIIEWESGMRTISGLAFAAIAVLAGGTANAAKPQAACHSGTIASVACGQPMCLKARVSQAAYSLAPRPGLVQKPVQLALYCPRSE